MRMTRAILIILSTAFIATLAASCQEAQSTTTEPTPVLTDVAKTAPAKQPQQRQVAQPAEEKTSESPDKQPKIEVENATHDFGKTGPSKRHQCEYAFKNVGQGTLIIKEIKSTCGCTVPELAKKKYEPGESGVIKVAFTAPAHEGDVSKHLYIISNDPENPRFELNVKASVELSIIADPPALQLSLKTENAGITPITIKSKDGKPFSIRSFSTIQRVITADIDPTKKAAEFTLNPKVDLEKLKKNLTGSITINLDHPDTRIIRITYTTPPPVEVRRQRIIVQQAVPGEATTKEVLILSNYDEDIAIESIIPTKGIMTIESQEESEKRISLQVKIVPPPKASAKTMIFSDRIMVRLTNGYEFPITCSGLYKKE